jgi:hypothetical protein
MLGNFRPWAASKGKMMIRRDSIDLSPKKIIDRSVSAGTFQQITLSPPPMLSAFRKE